MIVLALFLPPPPVPMGPREGDVQGAFPTVADTRAVLAQGCHAIRCDGGIQPPGPPRPEGRGSAGLYNASSFTGMDPLW